MVAELACVLTVSEHAAGALLGQSQALTTQLPLTLEALGLVTTPLATPAPARRRRLGRRRARGPGPGCRTGTARASGLEFRSGPAPGPVPRLVPLHGRARIPCCRPGGSSLASAPEDPFPDYSVVLHATKQPEAWCWLAAIVRAASHRTTVPVRGGEGRGRRGQQAQGVSAEEASAAGDRKRSHADWRVMPRAAPMRAQLRPLCRAIPTQAHSRSSTCAATAEISGRWASSASSVILTQGASAGELPEPLKSPMADLAQSSQMATPGPATSRRVRLADLAQKLHIIGPSSGGLAFTAFSSKYVGSS